MEPFNVVDYLKDDKEMQSEYLTELLNEYLIDGNKEALLVALKPLIELNGSISSFAKKTKISRTHFYKMFACEISPELDTLKKIINCLGFDIKISVKVA